MDDTTITAAPSHPGGPLIVFTSADYDEMGPDDLDRARYFNYEIDRVLEFYATLPGNVRRAVFSGGNVDGVEGMTVTLWTNDASMFAAADRDGHHKQQIDYHREKGHFDFSSFTRARIIASKGGWDGNDPVAQMYHGASRARWVPRRRRCVAPIRPARRRSARGSRWRPTRVGWDPTRTRPL
jgi:hypothetical protein